MDAGQGPSWVERLTDAACTGTVLDLAPEIDDKTLMASLKATWPAERCVPADALRQVLLEAKLHPDPRGLTLRGARIDGLLDFRYATLPCLLGLVRCSVPDGIDLRASHVPGLDLTGSRCGRLDLEKIQVNGSVFANKLTAEGQVRALGARITGQLVLQEARLVNPGGGALILESASIETLFLMDNFRIDGGVFLGGVRIGSFVTDERCPPQKSLGMLHATGWSLRDVHGWLRNDPQAAERWLLPHSKSDEFVPQPWYELANVYDRIGHTTVARRLRYDATKYTIRRQPLRVQAIQFFYRWLVGYGYYPLRTLCWFAGAFILAYVLIAANTHSFVPTSPVSAQTAYIATHSTEAADDAAVAINGATPCEDFGGRYPCLRPWSYAAATVTPASALQTPAWAPLVSWLEAVLMALKFLGWIFTAFLLAGLTGLLRKT